MASEWRVTVKSDQWDQMLENSRQHAGKLLRKAGFAAVGYVQEGEPVDTGFLRNSTEGEPGTLVFYIKIGADYWRFQNDGTRHTPPKYFVEEGVNRAIAELQADLAARWRKQ